MQKKGLPDTHRTIFDAVATAKRNTLVEENPEALN